MPLKETPTGANNFLAAEPQDGQLSSPRSDIGRSTSNRSSQAVHRKSYFGIRPFSFLWLGTWETAQYLPRVVSANHHLHYTDTMNEPIDPDARPSNEIAPEQGVLPFESPDDSPEESADASASASHDDSPEESLGESPEEYPEAGSREAAADVSHDEFSESQDEALDVSLVELSEESLQEISEVSLEEASEQPWEDLQTETTVPDHPLDDESGDADSHDFANAPEPADTAVASDAVTDEPEAEPADEPAPADSTPVEVLPAGFDPLGFTDPESIPPLDRPRPFRPPVIPLWVSYVSVALIIAIVAGIAGYAWWTRSSSVSTPVVVGMSETDATASIESVGLVVEVTERRFSTEPRGQVLEQDPTAGTVLLRGQSVSLIVSAGTEEFPMPDVVGDPLVSAQAALEERGLVVNVTTVESGEASDTVLSSVPGPGESVRTGDVVRLTVSKPAPDGGGLKPYILDGISVVIDAAPVANSATDPAMDITRRLRALLEAAGATVVTTRASTDPDTLTEADRATRAKEASASIAIGLSVAETGAAGRVVHYPASGPPQVVSSSARLASVLTSALAQSAPPATSANAGSDAVLAGTNVAWSRIRLGSLTAREDQTAFADPAWADKVARVIYTAIGQLYGLESSAP